MELCDEIGCQYDGESYWCTNCGLCSDAKYADASAFYAEEIADQRCRGKVEWSAEHALEDVMAFIRSADGMEFELRRVAIEVAKELPLDRRATMQQMRHIAGCALLEAGARTGKPITALDAAFAVGLNKGGNISALAHRLGGRTAPTASDFVGVAAERLMEVGVVPVRDLQLCINAGSLISLLQVNRYMILSNAFPFQQLRAGISALACNPQGATSRSLAGAACIRWAVEQRAADETICRAALEMAANTFAVSLQRIEDAALTNSSGGSGESGGSGVDQDQVGGADAISFFARALEKSHPQRWKSLIEAEVAASVDLAALVKMPITDQPPALRAALKRTFMLPLALLLRADRKRTFRDCTETHHLLRVDANLALSVTECRLGSLPQLIGIIKAVDAGLAM